MSGGHLQLFESATSTFTYVLFERPGGAAVIIDPVDPPPSAISPNCGAFR
jgi:hypothetical protein